MGLISLAQAGGTQRFKLTKKGSELQMQITETIGKNSIVNIKDPVCAGMLSHWIVMYHDICEWEFVHSQEVMVVSRSVDSKSEFDRINNELNRILKPYMIN